MDGRLLIDIANIGRDSTEVQKLNPVDYVLRNSPKSKRQVGLIGQEVARVEPLLVSSSFEIDYKALSTLLVAYVKDLETRVLILEQNQSANNLKLKKAKDAKI